MATVSASATIPRALPEVWSLYFDAERWAAWVDQFAAVVRLDPTYPASGAELVWRSGRAGRGEVRERVLEHEPRVRHRIEFADPASGGQLTSVFEAAEGGTAVTLTMAYDLVSEGLFAKLSDLLFVRAQMKSSLARSLEGLRAEASSQ